MSRPPLPFICEKQPASGSLGVVVANHPLGSSAGALMLAEGGNAVDAAVAALFTLTVVEPMMVGLCGGGIAHLRLADGHHLVLDALSTAGSRMHERMFDPDPAGPPGDMATVGNRNRVGTSAVAVPGNLRGWEELHRRFGRLPFADVVQPAIRTAERGFAVTPYLHGAIREHEGDLRADRVMRRTFLPCDRALEPGSRLVMGDYAETLRLVAREGSAALHGGELGRRVVERLAESGDPAVLTLDDLEQYAPRDRDPLQGTYRGWTVVGPPPPASAGIHVVEMLNVLEPFDLEALGFGSPASIALLAEAMRIAFEDRAEASGDPDFVHIPAARFMAKDHARERLAASRPARGSLEWPVRESADTTHVTTADRDGNVVCATHTINGLFGARIMVPETGLIPNNYMLNFDPRPGRAMSIAPGKRVPTSMAPMMILRDGALRYALGLPGAVRIFPSAMQAIVNLVDHAMTLQEAVEAPRIWTMDGHTVELEPALHERGDEITALGYMPERVRTVGGGMNAVEFGQDGTLTGAACWRADGVAVALGGGLARPGVRFRI